MATNVLELRWPDQRMMPQARPDDVSIGDRSDIRSAATVLERKARGHGLRIMVWPDLATLEELIDADEQPINACVFGWSEQDLTPWRNLDKILRSPLLRAARGASGPFWVDRHGIRGGMKDRFLEQVDLDAFDEHSPFAAAIIIPVHLPFGQIGAAILVSIDPDAQNLAAEFACAAAPLAPAVTRFVAGYAAVSRDGRYLPSDSVLSGREVECLSWVAHGKTDYEISIILGCSHAGVRYHMTRACAKLGAVNRAQSVFRACQLGYLGPAPANHHA